MGKPTAVRDTVGAALGAIQRLAAHGLHHIGRSPGPRSSPELEGTRLEPEPVSPDT